LLKNGKFEQRFSSWKPWQSARNSSNLLSIISIRDVAGCRNALRIENPGAKLIGLQQLVKVSSGKVYRISGSCRSTATSNSKILFGGRIGFWRNCVPLCSHGLRQHFFYGRIYKYKFGRNAIIEIPTAF